MSKEDIILNKLLSQVVTQDAIELHLMVGEYPVLRVVEKLVTVVDTDVVTSEYMQEVVEQILTKNQKDELSRTKSCNAIYVVNDRMRFKVNLFFQRGTLAASFRLISSESFDFKELGLPRIVEKLASLERGLVIVAGPFDAGKTTTVASIVEYINKTKSKRILTLEKPLEYIYTNNKSIIEQREVGHDTNSFAQGLKDSLSEDVDVVAVYKVVDARCVNYVLELAESGRLVIVQIEAESAEKVLEKLIRYFPDDEEEHVRMRLAESLSGIVVQGLLPRIGGGRVLAVEIAIATNPVKTLIREGRLSQLDNLMTISRAEGMINLDTSLAELVKTNEILINDALKHALKPENLRGILNT